MKQLVTVYSSNVPVDCYILKGRLDTDGIDSFIIDENIICVDPFKAVAVGGVKLKVPFDQEAQADRIIQLLEQGKLADGEGEYEINSIFEKEFSFQNEILEIKSKIRNEPANLEKPGKIKTDLLTWEELEEVIREEKKYREINDVKTDITWQRFWAELFDFEGRIFKYLRPKPVEFYFEQELVENYKHPLESKNVYTCPNCGSEEVSFGYAIDYKWGVLYLILSILVHAPFPLIRKNHHCFNCGHDFR